MKTNLLSIITSSLLLITACAEMGARVPGDSPPAKERSAVTKADAGTAKTQEDAFGWPKSCPVTMLGKDAFTPASQTPEGPPNFYDAVWYGTSELYTMINPDGKSSLNRWLGGEKTFWWSDNFSIFDEPEPDIAVTARRLDGQAGYEASQTTHGMRADIGDFMLVGVTLPEAGCWELTATYQGTSLSYVIWVQPKG